MELGGSFWYIHKNYTFPWEWLLRITGTDSMMTKHKTENYSCLSIPCRQKKVQKWSNHLDNSDTKTKPTTEGKEALLFWPKFTRAIQQHDPPEWNLELKRLVLAPVQRDLVTEFLKGHCSNMVSHVTGF